MRIALPFTEALSLATAGKPLPSVVQSVRCLGETVHAQVDLTAVSIRSIALRFAAAAAGEVSVAARFVGYEDGVATFAVTALARNLPAHKLLPFLIGPIDKAARVIGLPEGLLQIRGGSAVPLLLIDVQKAVAAKASGVRVTDLRLVDAVIHAEATIGDVTLR